MLKNILEKLIASIPLCFLTLAEDDLAIVWGVILMISLDTILGVWVGIKHRRLASHRLARLAGKVGKYGLAMMSVWVLAVVEPTMAWSFRWMGVFILLTEVISNFEKLALLGFKLPTLFISRINEQYQRLIGSNESEKSQIIKEMIENKDQINKYF